MGLEQVLAEMAAIKKNLPSARKSEAQAQKAERELKNPNLGNINLTPEQRDSLKLLNNYLIQADLTKDALEEQDRLQKKYAGDPLGLAYNTGQFMGNIGTQVDPETGETKTDLITWGLEKLFPKEMADRKPYMQKVSRPRQWMSVRASEGAPGGGSTLPVDEQKLLGSTMISPKLSEEDLRSSGLENINHLTNTADKILQQLGAFNTAGNENYSEFYKPQSEQLNALKEFILKFNNGQ